MIIRRATIEDRKQLLKLIHEFDEYFTKEKLFSEAVLPFARYKNKVKLLEEVVNKWLNNKENFVFVAEENGELVGHIVGSIQIKNDRVLDKEGSIDEWFIEEQFRNKGIGRQLYGVLLEVFKHQDCNYIGLKVYSANKNIMEMYHRMGFLDLEMTMVKKLD